MQGSGPVEGSKYTAKAESALHLRGHEGDTGDLQAYRRNAILTFLHPCPPTRRWASFSRGLDHGLQRHCPRTAPKTWGPCTGAFMRDWACLLKCLFYSHPQTVYQWWSLGSSHPKRLSPETLGSEDKEQRGPPEEDVGHRFTPHVHTLRHSAHPPSTLQAHPQPSHTLTHMRTHPAQRHRATDAQLSAAQPFTSPLRTNRTTTPHPLPPPGGWWDLWEPRRPLINAPSHTSFSAK